MTSAGLRSGSTLLMCTVRAFSFLATRVALPQGCGRQTAVLSKRRMTLWGRLHAGGNTVVNVPDDTTSPNAATTHAPPSHDTKQTELRTSTPVSEQGADDPGLTGGKSANGPSLQDGNQGSASPQSGGESSSTETQNSRDSTDSATIAIIVLVLLLTVAVGAVATVAFRHERRLTAATSAPSSYDAPMPPVAVELDVHLPSEVASSSSV